MSTFGPAFVEALDGTRIRGQLLTLLELMDDGVWRSLPEIHTQTGIPEASASAQLRHARKPRFGGFTVEKRRRHGAALWEYRVLMPIPDGQMAMPL